jgi:hypothetical protein
MVGYFRKKSVSASSLLSKYDKEKAFGGIFTCQDRMIEKENMGYHGGIF